MKLFRRQRHEQQPEPDRTEDWADVLRRHRTRGSRPMALELYKREHRGRRHAEAAPADPHPRTPSGRTSPPRESRVTPPREKSHDSNEATPDFPALTLDAPGLEPGETPPVFDESEEAKLRRRHGSITQEQWHW